jgi:hypothetical protein
MLGDRHPLFPSIDLLNRSNPITDKEFHGYAKIFRTELGEKVPVSTAHHYMHRDLKLWRFSAYEFVRLFTVRKMTKEDQKWYDAITSIQPQDPASERGRICHRFLLMAPHPLHKSHILVPRAKCCHIAKEKAICSILRQQFHSLVRRTTTCFEVCNMD